MHLKTVNVFVFRLLIDGLSKFWTRFALMGANPLSQYQVIAGAKSLAEMMKLQANSQKHSRN